MITVEIWLENIISVSGLLAVVSMACVLKMKSSDVVTKRLSEKFGKLWIAAEIMLFVLVGVAVDISYTMNAGIAAVGNDIFGTHFPLCRSVALPCRNKAEY